MSGGTSGEFSHVDASGEARMVDVSAKPATRRTARAEARVRLLPSTRDAITRGEVPKGAVLAVARIAGIQAAKRTGELIPLCHPLPVEAVEVEFDWRDDADRAVLVVRTSAVITARTGVEMEALTAATVAALTVYDMIKSRDRSAVIEGVRLVEKTGGKSGHYVADPGEEAEG